VRTVRVAQSALLFALRSGRNNPAQQGLCNWQALLAEQTMPVILLWAIPTVIVIGGGGYWLMHLHH
jgi:hypothetical protein